MASRTGTPASTPRSWACRPSAVAAATRNQPISASQRPPNAPVLMNAISPNTTSSHPKTRPAAVAPAVARSRSPVRHHRNARSSLPPSRGAAGTALKTASSTLMPASHATISTTIPDTDAR